MNELNGTKNSEHQKVSIVAEVGINHNGDMALARKLIIAAAEAGADSVKFQIIGRRFVTDRRLIFEYRSQGRLSKSRI